MPSIPNKLYFRIGEVSKLIGVEPYVLRYWESEFPDIKPSKSKSGQRLYKRKDVELLLKIKELLYEERYTINGARKRLKDWGRGEVKEAAGGRVGIAHGDEGLELEEGQRQLEAFPLDAEGSSDSVDAKGGRVPPSHAKTLVKIRRDLENLLGLVRE